MTISCVVTYKLPSPAKKHVLWPAQIPSRNESALCMTAEAPGIPFSAMPVKLRSSEHIGMQISTEAAQLTPGALFE